MAFFGILNLELKNWIQRESGSDKQFQKQSYFEKNALRLEERFENCKQLLEYQIYLFHRDIWTLSFYSIFK